MTYKTAAQAREDAKGLTFEIVWEALMEGRRQMEESQKRMDALNEESRKRMDALNEESQKRMDALNEESRKRMDKLNEESQKRMDKLTKQCGDLGNSLGELTEGIFSPDMTEQFRALGYTFTRQGGPMKYYRKDGSVLAEMDLLLENGDVIMFVEVKTKLTERHVNWHVERIEKIRQYMDERSDHRKIVGAVACGIVGENEKRYAYNHGFYVIVQSGEAVKLADPPPDFRVRVW